MFGGGVVILVEMVEGEVDGISGVYGRWDEINLCIVLFLLGYCVSVWILVLDWYDRWLDIFFVGCWFWVGCCRWCRVGLDVGWCNFDGNFWFGKSFVVVLFGLWWGCWRFWWYWFGWCRFGWFVFVCCWWWRWLNGIVCYGLVFGDWAGLGYVLLKNRFVGFGYRKFCVDCRLFVLFWCVWWFWNWLWNKWLNWFCYWYNWILFVICFGYVGIFFVYFRNSYLWGLWWWCWWWRLVLFCCWGWVLLLLF